MNHPEVHIEPLDFRSDLPVFQGKDLVGPAVKLPVSGLEAVVDVVGHLEIVAVHGNAIRRLRRGADSGLVR